MSIDNFKKEDLVGRSLERLLDEIDSLSKDGTVASYIKLEKFINELAKVTADATVKVAKSGKQTMGIRDDEIELIATIKQVTDKINEGIDGNQADASQHAAREVLRKTIADTIGVLLKEDEIMQALAARGVTNEEFIKNAEKEIERSKEKVKTLKPLLDEQKALKDLFGKTIYLETTKSYMSKSQLDELKHDKLAAELLTKVQDKLEELRKLQEGARTMDPSSANYATDFGNNQAAMDVLLADVKGLAGDLKALGLRTAPVGSPADRKTQDIDFKYLELLDKGSDFVTAKSTTQEIAINPPSGNKTIEQLIEDDYTNIKETMKRDFAKFGFANEAEIDALTNEQVDKKLASIEQEFNKIDDEIKYEEAYQEQTRVAMERFKTKTERETELAGKFREVTRTRRVQRRDADGNLVTDADGNPVMVEESYIDHEPTDDARRDYLASAGVADETAYKQSKVDEARATAETAVNALSRADKRALIRRAYQREGEIHPLKWLRSQFFTGSMWDRDYKNAYLTDKVTTAENAALTQAEAELKTKVEAVAKKDLSDRKTLTAELGLVRNAYKQAIVSAVSQEKMTDELYNGQTEAHVTEGAMRAGMNYSLNLLDAAELAVASTRLRNNEITLEEFNRIQTEKAARDLKKVKMDPKTNQDRAHADEVINPNTSRKPQTPTYEDR